MYLQKQTQSEQPNKRVIFHVFQFDMQYLESVNKVDKLN